MNKRRKFQELMSAFEAWCALHSLSASAKAFMRSVLLLGMAKENASLDADRAEHARTFEVVIRVRAGQIIGRGC